MTLLFMQDTNPLIAKDRDVRVMRREKKLPLCLAQAQFIDYVVSNERIVQVIFRLIDNHGALQLVAYSTVKGIPNEQTIRLAKWRKLVTGRDAPSRIELERKFVSLVKESDDTDLARLIVEAGLVEAVSFAREIEKGEPLQLAAHAYGVDIATVRDGGGEEEGEEVQAKQGGK